MAAAKIWMGVPSKAFRAEIKAGCWKQPKEKSDRPREYGTGDLRGESRRNGQNGKHDTGDWNQEGLKHDRFDPGVGELFRSEWDQSERSFLDPR